MAGMGHLCSALVATAFSGAFLGGKTISFFRLSMSLSSSSICEGSRFIGCDELVSTGMFLFIVAFLVSAAYMVDCLGGRLKTDQLVCQVSKIFMRPLLLPVTTANSETAMKGLYVQGPDAPSLSYLARYQ